MIAKLSDKNTVDRKYDCQNRPAPHKAPPLPVQIGWKDGKRVMHMHRTEWNPIPCGHTERASDARCSGCHWRLK